MMETAKLVEQLYSLCNEYQLNNSLQQVTFEEHYNDYLKNLEGKGSSRAFSNKVNMSKTIINDLKGQFIKDLDIDTMSRYINSWTTRTYKRGGKDCLYSQSHIDKIYTNLKCVFRLAVLKGIILHSVMEDIECPISKKYVNYDNLDLTDDEIKSILFAFNGNIMWKTAIILMVYTGIRPGELFALKFSGFDYTNNTVKICRTLSIDIDVDVANKCSRSSIPLIKLLKNEINGKKEYARRVLSLSNNVIESVKKCELSIKNDVSFYRKKHLKKTADYLFTAPKDGEIKKPDYYANVYRNCLKQKCINPSVYNMYRFRHTFCTRLFRVHKLDPKTVQLMMGDSSLDMILNVYHSVNKEDMIIASGEYSKAWILH